MSQSSIRSVPGWESMTGQELFEFCQTHPSTNNPVQSAPLQKWLRLNRLFSRSVPGGGVEGVLVNATTNPNLPENLREQLKGMISQFLEDPFAEIETHLDEYGPLFSGLLSVITVSEEQLIEFYKLGGGRKYPVFADATAAQAAIDAELVVVAKENLIANIRRRFDAILNQIGTSEQPDAVLALEEIANELKAK